VPAVVEATEQAYRHRAGADDRWPPVQWMRRMRPDPLRRLHLERHGVDRRPVRGSSAAPTPLPRSSTDAGDLVPGSTAAERAASTWRPRDRRAGAAAASPGSCPTRGRRRCVAPPGRG
jgi:hypothetical protein